MTSERQQCHKCEAPIRRAVWLELDRRDNSWHKPGSGIPAEESGGLFPFGEDCARRAIHRACELGSGITRQPCSGTGTIKWGTTWICSACEEWTKLPIAETSLRLRDVFSSDGRLR